MSQAHRLKILPNLNRKGKTWTPEQRTKIMNHIRSGETRIKISLSHRGSKSHFWKGGTTQLTDVLRNTFRYRQWRADVYDRDNYTCQKCFTRGGSIEAHHIKAMHIILKENNVKNLDDAHGCEELWSINNGQTLCMRCHKSTSSYGPPTTKIKRI